MRRYGAMLLVLSLGVFVASACKHNDGAQIDKDDDPSGKKAKAKKEKEKEPPPEKTGKVPDKHRTEHVPCSKADTPAPGTTTFGPKAITPPGPACKSKADCTDKKNGRCSSGHCTYDGCYEDSDCGKAVCECREQGIHGYFCKAGNCAVDTDCGAGGYCSPTFGMSCGSFTGVIGYYCHSNDDECVNDSECTEKGQGYCAYDDDKKHWRCGYGHCVG